jgi:hypothetical protein
VIKAIGEVKVDATRRRAIVQVIAEESKKQENLEAMARAEQPQEPCWFVLWRMKNS